VTYGCYNRPAYREVSPAQDGYYLDGVTRTPRLTAVRHVLSRDCQYTHSALGQADAGCQGCKHRQQGAA
jgi:hypothetical protein